MSDDNKNHGGNGIFDNHTYSDSWNRPESTWKQIDKLQVKEILELKKEVEAMAIKSTALFIRCKNLEKLAASMVVLLYQSESGIGDNDKWFSDREKIFSDHFIKSVLTDKLNDDDIINNELDTAITSGGILVF